MSPRALLWLSLAAALVALLLLLVFRSPGAHHRRPATTKPQPTCSLREVLLPPLQAAGRRDAVCPLQTPKYSHLDHVLLGGLLVVSVAWALAEVCRDRLRAPDKVIGEPGVPGMEPGRRCSLADLTVIRHARRESVQLLEAAGRTVPRLAAEHGPRRNSYIAGVRPPLQRRSSFPAQLVSHLQKQASLGDGPRLSRRTSVDLSEEDSSPDTRRRVRMLRRH